MTLEKFLIAMALSMAIGLLVFLALQLLTLWLAQRKVQSETPLDATALSMRRANYWLLGTPLCIVPLRLLLGAYHLPGLPRVPLWLLRALWAGAWLLLVMRGKGGGAILASALLVLVPILLAGLLARAATAQSAYLKAGIGSWFVSGLGALLAGLAAGFGALLAKGAPVAGLVLLAVFGFLFLAMLLRFGRDQLYLMWRSWLAVSELDARNAKVARHVWWSVALLLANLVLLPLLAIGLRG